MLLTPIKAIRKKCLDCMGNQYGAVRLCEAEDCPLHPYRMGKRPKTKIDRTDECKPLILKSKVVGI